MENLFDNTILIVDDTHENIDILVDLLKDFQTKVAVNGEDALEIAFKDKAPDLILLDILMPGIDGYEVCRRLRVDERTRDVPIIFLTVKKLKDDIVKGFELGGQDYVTKPFDGRELIERVKTQLELKTQRETLKNMNFILEEKVQKRTSQLQNALSKLDEANKELLGLNIAKNNFLHMISHEIRTPLNGIVGAACLLNDVIEEDSELGTFLEMLQLNVDRLEEFSITALLITQLKTGYYKILSNPFNIKKLIGTCIDTLKEYAIKQDVAITIDVVDPLLEINLDGELIQRALKSVIHNSIKHSTRKGKVKVSAYIKDKKAIIEVIDNGSGFEEEILNSLLHPFEIGDEHYDKNIGLNLHAAEMIMKAHQGTLIIDNLPGSGAIVKFVLNN